ncbi:MAG: hypothetical protein OXF46_00135 [Rhodobacteraceae bacterium]|nr:hypothetical protein [Paracoccaceae bacterium]
MLNLNMEPFAPYVANYYDEIPHLDSPQTSIFVEIAFPGHENFSTYARLDPATPWVVLNNEIAENLGFSFNEKVITLRTIGGDMKGTLERHPIELLALEGPSITIDATIFVCREWQRECFLGYSGFLERIRFAVDPSTQRFYFGEITE